MKQIRYILKSSKVAYSIYYYTFSSVFKLLSLLIKQDPLLILFNSYGGKKYDDNPKEIYEAMIKDARFNKYKLVWAFLEPDSIPILGRAQKIKADSIHYFITALKARIWITNSSIERGLSFKKANTICLNTWHGSAIKKMGIDIPKDNQSFRSINNVTADIILSQSQYDNDVFSHAFQIPEPKFRLTGYPRNDTLTKYSENDISGIRNRLNLDKNKIVLLYAPTFREYTKGNQNEIVHKLPIDLIKWQNKLGKRFVVLFRAHYEVSSHTDVKQFSVFRDVSTYPNLNDLIVVSDALISDYSSIIFDYSITHKRIFCYAYDYDTYKQKRGFYFDLEKEIPSRIYKDEDSLLNDITEQEGSLKENNQKTISFQQKYVTQFGHASEDCLNIIWDKIQTHSKNT